TRGPERGHRSTGARRGSRRTSAIAREWSCRSCPAPSSPARPPRPGSASWRRRPRRRALRHRPQRRTPRTGRPDESPVWSKAFACREVRAHHRSESTATHALFVWRRCVTHPTLQGRARRNDGTMTARRQLLIEGSVHDAFEPVREAFVANFERRGELGSACCIYQDGEKVVDLWGGVRDRASGSPWRADTMVVVHSATKGMAAMVMALAHSRGWL